MTNLTIDVLILLTQNLPVGTNLALLHFFWMLVTGALFPTRGAIIPALKSIGLSDAATRRAWVAFRKGAWPFTQRKPGSPAKKCFCGPGWGALR